MIDVLRAEWIKRRTTTNTSWLLIGIVALTVGFTAAVAAAVRVLSGSNQDPTKLSLTGIYLGQMVVTVFAVLAIGDEYGTGMIVSSLTAVPRRHVLLIAKAATVAGLTFVAGLLAVAGCLVIGRHLLPADGLDPAHRYALVSISQVPTMRAAIGSVLYLVLIALLSLGIATAIRDTAVSIGAVLGLLYLPPVLAQVVSDPLRRYLQQSAPMTAGLTIQATTNLHSLPIAPWTGLGVLAAWSAAALLAGGLLLQVRDA